jgi:3-deoxy-manno-octulosonate cytidylyltransferase (CMP-KDO synthetase)
VQVSALKVAISSDSAKDPNAVKLVTDLHDRALYFSRAPVLYDRESSGRTQCYKHLGFYAYTVQALRQFRSLPRGPLEETEQLERLGFLENGIPITVIETTEDTIGVDIEEDLERVEEYFRRSGVA